MTAIFDALLDPLGSLLLVLSVCPSLGLCQCFENWLSPVGIAFVQLKPPHWKVSGGLGHWSHPRVSVVNNTSCRMEIQKPCFLDSSKRDAWVSVYIPDLCVSFHFLYSDLFTCLSVSLRAREFPTKTPLLENLT